MIYEVRTYTLRTGAVADSRIALPAEAAPGEALPLGAFWHTTSARSPGHPRWPYDNLQQRTAVRDAMAKDEALSPAGGPRSDRRAAVRHHDSRAVHEALAAVTTARQLYEMRIYTYAPGDLRRCWKRGQGVPGREKLSRWPPAGRASSVAQQVRAVWVYKDSNERNRP